VTNLEGLGSRDVRIVVEHKEHNGTTRAEIAWVNSAGGVKEEEKMGAGEKSAFKSRMKGLLASMGVAGPAKTAEEPPPLNDSDIPF
jgi:hypothetical protein